MLFCNICKLTSNSNNFSNTQLKKKIKVCKNCTIKPQIVIRKSRPINRLIGAKYEKPLHMQPNKLKYYYRLRDMYDDNTKLSKKNYVGLYKEHLDYKYYFRCESCYIKKAKKDFSLSSFKKKQKKDLICKKCINISL